MQNFAELVTGSFNFVWGMASFLTIAVFAAVLAVRETSADVRRLMRGVMLAAGATMVDKLWWTAFRFNLYQGDEDGARFFMDNAHMVVASAALVGVFAYFLHVFPYLERNLGGLGLIGWWIGAAVFLGGYAAIVH